jgi:cytochrome c2
MSSMQNRLWAASAGVAVLIGAGGLAYDKMDFRQRMRSHAAEISGGVPTRGEARFISYGCGGCHAMKHVPHALGGVGPRLDGVALQTVIAGRLSNKPDNMRRWIRAPQSVSPGTAMPNLGVTERDARDISAFLYSRPD